MRRLSPSLVLAAAALALTSFTGDASARPFGHGFRGSGKAFVHRGVRHAGLHRFGHGRFAHHHFGHHHFGHGFHSAFLGSPWLYDSYGYGAGAPVNVSVEQSVAAGGYGPPVSTGIRSEPAAQPVIYVIRSGSGPRPLVRKGDRGRAKVASLRGGRAAEPSETGSLGPRIVEVTAPRGF
jgi:hypothetical protein